MKSSVILKSIYSFLLFLCINIFAQEGNFKIYGTVINGSHKVSSAQVYLFTPQNQLVKTAVVQNGVFEFEEVKPAPYYLQVNSENMSQKEPVFKLSENRNFTILLSAKVSDIEEVEISGKRKTVQIRNGNFYIDMANSALSKMPTATDVLSKLPYVSVDPNGEGLSMTGKGVPLLYIDSQRVDFSTLSAVSVDDIKSVEIIRNPSVKYEAEGKAVIKIVLKTSRREGYSITLNETASVNRRFSNNFSVNFQQKKNKTEWKLNAAYNQIQHWESNGFEYAVPTRNISSDYIIKSVTDRPQTVFGAHMYQDLNDGDYLTFAVNANLRPDKGNNTTVTHYERDGIYSQIQSLDQQNRQRASVNSVFNYNKQLKSAGANIFGGLQFTRESNNADHHFYNNIDNAGSVFSQFRKQKYAVNAFSGRIDAEKKIKENYQLGIGAGFTKAEAITDNLTDYKNIHPSEYFSYLFQEENWASYAEFSGEKEKFSFKGGLRMEATSAKGFTPTANQANINRKYVDWFPGAEISFKQNKEYEYTLNYNRSISRPGYVNLASGGLYSSPYVEYDGNPNLLPTYTHTVSASARLKKWTLNVSVYRSRNPMGFGLFYDEKTDVSKFTTQNFDREVGAGLGLDFPFENRFLTSQNSLSLNYSKTQDRLAVTNKPTPYLYFYTNNTIKLGKNFNFLADGSWITERVQGIYEYNGMITVNLGLMKSVSNFDFTVRCNDIFKQNTYIQKLSYDKIVTKGSFYGNTPVFSLGIKYRFGKVSSSAYREKPINETVDRI